MRLEQLRTIMACGAGSDVAYTRFSGADLAVELGFQHDLQLKHKAYKHSKTVRVIVQVQLAVCAEAAQTQIKLQRVHAFIAADDAGSSGCNGSSRLSSRAALSQVQVEVSAHSQHDATTDEVTWHQLQPINPSRSDKPYSFWPRRIDTNYYKCVNFELDAVHGDHSCLTLFTSRHGHLQHLSAQMHLQMLLLRFNQMSPASAA